MPVLSLTTDPTSLDKFVPFLKTKGIGDWNGITEKTLTDYAAHLTEREYAYKTIHNELTTIKQAFASKNWPH